MGLGKLKQARRVPQLSRSRQKRQVQLPLLWMRSQELTVGRVREMPRRMTIAIVIL